MSRSYGFNSFLVFFFFFEKYNNKKSTKKHALSFLKKHKKASVKHASLNEPSFRGKKRGALGFRALSISNYLVQRPTEDFILIQL